MSTIRLFGYDAPSMNAFAPEAEGDDALFARYRARRDDDALAALLGRHWTRAFSLAQRIVRDPALAEDAAQEAFVKLARATGGYDERGRFAAFLTAIVVNEARNALRAKRRRGGHEETAGRARGGAPGGGRSDGGGGAGGSGGGRSDDDALAVAVDRRLARLPEDLRTPLVLRYHEGLTHEEVAAALGIAPGTASSRLRRGLDRLRESLAEAGLAAAIPSLETLLGRPPALPPAPPPPPAASIRARAAAEAAGALSPVAAAGGAAVLAAVALGAWLALGGSPDPAAPAAARAPAGAPAPALAPGRGLGETDGSAAAPDVAARGGAGDPAAARPEERAASGPPPAGPARAPEAPAPAPAPPAGPLPAREALARAVARLGEVPLVALDLRTERGGDRLSATVTARPATGEFRVESRGGYPLDFGYDGVFWWISWVGANEVLRRAPKAGSPHDYVRLAREEALGLTLEMLPVFEAVAYAGPALRAGESPSVVDFRVASAEGAATIDPADGRLRAFELRTPAGGGPLFLAGRYAYPGDGDVPAGAFRDLPAGEDAAWRVAEDDESRAVIVRIERDRLGRVEVQGFIEGAPSLLAGASAAEARGRDDRGVAYRGLAPRLHDSQTENDLASSPAFGLPFRVLLAPEEGDAGRALEARTMEIAVAGLTFPQVRLPGPARDALPSVEPGDVAPGDPAPAPAGPTMAMCFPAAVLLGAVPHLAPPEEEAILAASRAGRLTIEALAATVGAERAAAVQRRFPIIRPGLALRVLERSPALPYMLVRVPGGAGDRITIRPARIRDLFPDVSEPAVAALVAEGRAGRLTVARLSEVVLGGKPLPGPDGRALDPRTPVSLLEP